jgi:hypothetical protein
MADKPADKRRPDWATYVKNRSKWLPDDLLPYAGQWVAWSADGSRIVAHHEDLLEAARMVEAEGLDREDVVFDCIPPGGEVTTLL